jgi:TonB family protein
MSSVQSWVLDYLLNAAWQVPLLFATAWVLARLLRSAGPAVEHRIWASALVLETFLPACSLPSDQLTTAMTALHSWLLGTKSSAGAQVTVSVGAGYVRGGVHLAPMLLTVLIALYAASLLYFAARLLIAAYRTAALRRGTHPTMLLAESARRYERIFAVREPLIATSTKVNGPVTLGIWRHTILLPEVIQADLTEDLEAALAHEFAHIARNDFAKNLLYELLSLPVAFHPLLWLTRRRVAETREITCDAMAAEAVQGRQKYARSLLRLASEFATRTPAVSTHAIGIFDANTFRNFERRVMSLTEKRMEMRGARRSAMIALSVALGAVVCTSAMALRMQVAGAQQSAPVMVQTLPVVAPVPAVVPTPKSMSVMAAPAPKISTAPILEAKVMPLVIAAPSAAASPQPVEEPLSPQERVARISGGVMAGNILTKVQPVYPQEAKDKKISGAVVMKAVIGKDGAIKELQVVTGPDELKASALDAVKQWTYKPYLLNGEPTEVQTIITVNYSLAGE